MPVIKSAKKKLRQDIKRTAENKKKESLVKALVKKAQKNPSKKSLSDAFSAIDKAAKINIFHKNKAGRMKSSLAKLGKDNKQKQKSTPKRKSKSVVKSINPHPSSAI